MQVTDRLLELVVQVPGLESLHVGHMRLQPERLAALSSHMGLRELTVHGEELSQAALAALASFTRLQALGMTTCYQVRSPTRERENVPCGPFSAGVHGPCRHQMRFT